MLTHTIEVNQLDTITKHLIEINQQLVSIKHDTMASDATKTVLIVLTVASPLIVGFLLFLLNRNKEHHQKKSELCGDIYACVEEWRMANGEWITAHINYLGTLRIDEIANEKNYHESDRQEVGQVVEDSKKELDTIIKNLNTAVRNLRKQVGTYRFYLPRSKRPELDNLMEPFLKRWMLEYDFSDLTEIDHVTKKLKETTQTYINEQTPIDGQRYEALLKFIDEQNEDFIPNIG